MAATMSSYLAPFSRRQVRSTWMPRKAPVESSQFCVLVFGYLPFVVMLYYSSLFGKKDGSIAKWSILQSPRRARLAQAAFPEDLPCPGHGTGCRATDTSGVGTRNAMPVNLPLTALEEPQLAVDSSSPDSSPGPCTLGTFSAI